MEKSLILAVVVLLFGSVLSFTGLYLCLNNRFLQKNENIKKELIFLPIFLVLFALTLLIYLTTEVDIDFIYTLKIFEVLLPWLLAGISYALTLSASSKKYVNYAILLSVVVSVFLLPSDFFVFKGALPLWADRLALAALWLIISFFYPILNGLEGVLGLYNMAFGIGLLIIFLLGGAPLFWGLSGLALLSVSGSFTLLNWPPSKIKLSNDSCKIFGFIIGWMMCFSSTENLLPCWLILLSLFLAELINALLKKASLSKEKISLSAATTYYQANISGLDNTLLLQALAKIYIVVVILACFQLYIDNAYSLPIVTFALAEWFLSKLRYWNIPDQSLKELNQNLISNIKDSLNKIKNDQNQD